jgi:hypothetical protein
MSPICRQAAFPPHSAACGGVSRDRFGVAVLYGGAASPVSGEAFVDVGASDVRSLSRARCRHVVRLSRGVARGWMALPGRQAECECVQRGLRPGAHVHDAASWPASSSVGACAATGGLGLRCPRVPEVPLAPLTKRGAVGARAGDVQGREVARGCAAAALQPRPAIHDQRSLVVLKEDDELRAAVVARPVRDGIALPNGLAGALTAECGLCFVGFSEGLSDLNSGHVDVQVDGVLTKQSLSPWRRSARRWRRHWVESGRHRRDLVWIREGRHVRASASGRHGTTSEHHQGEDERAHPASHSRSARGEGTEQTSSGGRS